MFSIENISSMNVADVCMTSKRGLLYGVIELNAKDTYPAGAARLVLAGAVGAAAGASEAGWPSAMAGGVASTLGGFTSNEYPSQVMGAFLSICGSLVHLCWAGTIRVHLIRRGTTIRVTNDHNLIDDPSEGVSEMLLSAPPDVIAGFRYCPSRTIDPQASRPPESQTWEMEAQDVLLICSAIVHRNAAPSEYVQKLIGDYTEMLCCEGGLIAVIRPRPPVV